jgi:hypothetical protein
MTNCDLLFSIYNCRSFSRSLSQKKIDGRLPTLSIDILSLIDGQNSSLAVKKASDNFCFLHSAGYSG